MNDTTPIGIVSWGTYTPAGVETAADIAAVTGIPEQVIVEKIGLRKKHVAGPGDHCAEMAARAGRQALDRAGLAPSDIDLVIYHGSEYKNYFVWSAATKVQQLLGTENAGAFELYALCAGTPVALKTARALMRDDPHLRHVLLVTASRENDLVDYNNERARFMFNFGTGAGALLLRRDTATNEVLNSAIVSDGMLSETVVMPAGGSVQPGSEETITQKLHMLDVLDLDYMAERLGAVSLRSFSTVITRAVVSSGYRMQDIDFLCLVHMKRSFHDAILGTLDLSPEQAIYLDEYGHMQSVDQIVALELAHQQGRLHDGDLVVFAAAGTGYTWSATALRWGDQGRAATTHPDAGM